MLRSLARYVVPAVVAVLFAAAPAAAQKADSSRTVIARLFTDAVGKVSDATVRVRSNGMEVALGTVVAADGYILTKADELIARGKVKRDLSVVLRDGTILVPEVVGIHRDTDLAMLKVDATDLTAVAFTDGKQAAVGNWVVATSPGSDPVAAGVVSAGVRKLFGPEALIEKGNKGYLGILLDKPTDQDGVLVTQVNPGSAAARAKMRKGDIIVRVADKTVAGPDELKKILEDYRPGDKVIVAVKRGENEQDLEVRLGALSDFDRGAFQNKMGSDLSNRRSGFPSVIQHDMVLKPADCGGPLADLDGNVLGINIARAGRVETWALPGEVIRPLIKQLRDGKFPPPSETK